MSGSGRVFRRSDGGRTGESAAVTSGARGASRPLLDDVAGLLDEIDEVLEVNAEEFVRGYVQKGGE